MNFHSNIFDGMYIFRHQKENTIDQFDVGMIILDTDTSQYNLWSWLSMFATDTSYIIGQWINYLAIKLRILVDICQIGHTLLDHRDVLFFL